jgi:hypothetical protein
LCASSSQRRYLPPLGTFSKGNRDAEVRSMCTVGCSFLTRKKLRTERDQRFVPGAEKCNGGLLRFTSEIKAGFTKISQR